MRYTGNLYNIRELKPDRNQAVCGCGRSYINEQVGRWGSQEHVNRHIESEQRTENRLDIRIARSHTLNGSQDFTGDVKVQGIDPHGLCSRFNQPSQQRGQYGAEQFGLTWPFTLSFRSLRLLHHYRQYFNRSGFQLTWCCVKHLTVSSYVQFVNGLLSLCAVSDRWGGVHLAFTYSHRFQQLTVNFIISQMHFDVIIYRIYRKSQRSCDCPVMQHHIHDKRNHKYIRI